MPKILYKKEYKNISTRNASGIEQVSQTNQKEKSTSPVRTFVLRLLLFIAPIVLIPVTLYIVFDPFKVLYQYDSYYASGKPLGVFVNRGFVSLQTFKNNYPKYQYDSYIFGNSRSLYYQVDDWKKHINSNGFHSDASSESLTGMYQFLKYVDEYGAQIKNALFVIDHELLSDKKEEAHYLIKPPELTGGSSFSFQLEFFNAFLDQNFFKAFMDWKITSKIKPYMKKSHVLDDIIYDYKDSANELSFTHYEKMIANNPNDYYTERMGLFYPRSNKKEYWEPVIKEEQKKILFEIKKILQKQKTDFKIIISPLYDQKYFSPDDLKILKSIFGQESVFDFSGKNELTENFKNYYEASHYRPHVAKIIMDSIYANKRRN